MRKEKICLITLLILLKINTTNIINTHLHMRFKFDYDLLKFYLIQKLPFFIKKNFLYTNQLWEGRPEVLKSIMDNFDGPINVLEIGVWFGEGSTQILLDYLPDNSILHLVDYWDNYISDHDLKDGLISTKLMNSVSKHAFSNVLNKVSLNSRLKINIHKGKSSDQLPFFRDKSFDLIYIDGSHYYSDVKQDVVNAKRLIKKNGIICGDDLEIFPNDEIYTYSKSHLTSDVVTFNGHSYHPGVLMAIYEEFKNIEMKNGIWWVK